MAEFRFTVKTALLFCRNSIPSVILTSCTMPWVVDSMNNALHNDSTKQTLAHTLEVKIQ